MRRARLALMLCLGCTPMATAAPDYHEVRRDLIETMCQHDLLYQACLLNVQNYRTPGYRATSLVGYRRGPQGRRLRLVVSQGSLQETKDPYNVAIEGDGYFLLSDGRITRNGAFRFERSGHLVTADGAFLMGYPQSQQSNLEPLQVPLDFCNLTIEGDGKVMGTQLNGDGKPVQLGQIVLGQVDDGSWLDRSGPHLARNADCGAMRTAIPGQDGLGVVAQGYLEYSNVNPLQQVRILSALTNYADLLGLPVFDQYLP